MSYYRPNPMCHCGRCSTRGLTGPAVLVTLGVLFLLANTSDYPIERTWPILLIVIGAVRVIRYVMPDSEHINPEPFPPYGGQYAPGGYPPPPPQPPNQGPYPGAAQNVAPASAPIVTPPPAPIAGRLGDGSGESNEVHNG